ncbi:uncharacterized protein [Hyperolius riggenbachi]|uniref:uncharacterized protein n=1 Tax=Hyperolius riggenbachi TaxID=752182 RepID=UPI0035A2C94C
MTFRGLEVTLVLCILLRRACNSLLENGDNVIDGLVNQHITLPCYFIVADNWKDNEIQVLWFRNFSDKLVDCTVTEGKTPRCQVPPNLSRIQFSGKSFDNVSLDIYNLQKSDEGQYQCWIMLKDAYRRQDTMLRVHSNRIPDREASSVEEPLRWHLLAIMPYWNTFLISGWSIALFLAGIILAQKFRRRKKIYNHFTRHKQVI